MGLYSRWASIALFHHAIVRLAAIRVGIKDFTDYLVLGDDIVIASETVYREYLILMGYLGVDISTRKVLPVGAASGAQAKSPSHCKMAREGKQGSIAKRWSRRTGSPVKGRIEFRGVE